MKHPHTRWLDQAHIEDPDLRNGYELCRILHSQYGRTYYLATLLLPPAKRPFVNSLYGFARYTDEIVDNGDPDTKESKLRVWTDQVLAHLEADRGTSADPICRTLVHTMRTWGIRVEWVKAFLDSMLMDLNVTEYPTYEHLRTYMYGSAAVIGLQMVPILEPISAEAYPRAQALGEAFQLTNFVRDVAEDLKRGRVYLPLEDLDRYNVSRADLTRGELTPAIRALLRFEIARIRELYAYAEGGIDLLAPSSRECIRTAYLLYGGILREVERADYRIFDRRISVPLSHRIRVAGAGYIRARCSWAG